MSILFFYFFIFLFFFCYAGRNKIFSLANIHQFGLLKYFCQKQCQCDWVLHVYLLYTTFGQIDRNTVVVLIKYAYLNVFIIIIQFIVMCTLLSVVKEIRNCYTIAFLRHIHTNSIHPTDSVSKCKTNMPQNNLIIVDF